MARAFTSCGSNNRTSPLALQKAQDISKFFAFQADLFDT